MQLNFLYMNKYSIKGRKLFSIIPILVLSAILRIYMLGGRSYWEDEMTVLLRSKMPLSELLKFLRVEELYDVSLGVVINYIFTHISDSEFFTRLPFAICGIISVFLLYKLGCILFNKKIGLLASFFLAISPLHIRYSQENRHYTLFGMAFLIAIIFFYKFIGNNRIKNMFYYLAASIVAAATHIFHFAVIISNIITLLVFCIYNFIINQFNRSNKISIIPYISLILIIVIGISLFTYLWFPQLFHKVIFEKNVERVWSPFISTVPQSFLNDVLFKTFAWFALPVNLNNIHDIAFHMIVPYSSNILNYVFMMIIVVMMFSLTKKNDFIISFSLFLLIIFSLLFIYYAAKIEKEYFTMRRIIFLIPVFYLLLSKGIFEISSLFKTKKNGYICLIVPVIIYSMFYGEVLIGYYNWPKTNWKESIEYINDKYPSGEIAVACMTDPKPMYCYFSRLLKLDYDYRKYNALRNEKLLIIKDANKKINIIANYKYLDEFMDKKSMPIMFLIRTIDEPTWMQDADCIKDILIIKEKDFKNICLYNIYPCIKYDYENIVFENSIIDELYKFIRVKSLGRISCSTCIFNLDNKKIHNSKLYLTLIGNIIGLNNYIKVYISNDNEDYYLIYENYGDNELYSIIENIDVRSYIKNTNRIFIKTEMYLNPQAKSVYDARIIELSLKQKIEQ